MPKFEVIEQPVEELEEEWCDGVPLIRTKGRGTTRRDVLAYPCGLDMELEFTSRAEWDNTVYVHMRHHRNNHKPGGAWGVVSKPSGVLKCGSECVQVVAGVA